VTTGLDTVRKSSVHRRNRIAQKLRVNVHTLCSKNYTQNPVLCLYVSFPPVKECDGVIAATFTF